MEDDEKNKIGYNAAIQMASSNGNMIWAAFGALIGANAVFVTLIGVVMKLYEDIDLLPILMSLLGIILCVIWFFTISRQFAYTEYWLIYARNLEKKTLAPQVDLLEKGKSYGEGKVIHLEEQHIFMPWFGRVFKVKQLASAVIYLFLVLYILEFILSIKGETTQFSHISKFGIAIYSKLGIL